MEECQKKGKTKAIGVSNFSQAEMERLLKETSIVCVHPSSVCLRIRQLTLNRASGTSSAPIRYDPSLDNRKRR